MSKFKLTTNEKVENLLRVMCQTPLYDLCGDEGTADYEGEEFSRPTDLGYADYSQYHKSVFMCSCDGGIYEMSVKKISEKQYYNLCDKGFIDRERTV